VAVVARDAGPETGRRERDGRLAYDGLVAVVAVLVAPDSVDLTCFVSLWSFSLFLLFFLFKQIIGAPLDSFPIILSHISKMGGRGGGRVSPQTPRIEHDE
jgi:hypothetical protein